MLLGQKTLYKDAYDNKLLDPIKRTLKAFKMIGYDFWNCYEFSWLTPKGKPVVRLLEFAVEANSKNIVESKSVKLYLNSFHNSKFENEQNIVELIQKDLHKAASGKVLIKIKTLESQVGLPLTSFKGINLDLLDIAITDYQPNKNLLKLDKGTETVHEILYSNLFKANCLVTGQPDWGAVQIAYKGKKIDHESVLRYLLSYRQHNEFAEPAAENIFTDIMQQCTPDELTVYLRFTRRGGIDINPIRSTHDLNVTDIDNRRQVRQ